VVRHVPARAAMASICRAQTPWWRTSSETIRNAAISAWVNLAARAGGIGPEAARCRRRAMDAWRSGERCRRAFGGGGAFGALASLRSRMASAAAWASSSDNAPAAYAFHSSADRWSSCGVRAAAMARVNWSVNIESAFRGATRRRAVDSGKAGAWRKKALASIQIFGKDRDCNVTNFPGFAGHRPAFHGGFCVSGC
jgi:hypothetical protein